jgi:hypothetical protein
LVDKIADLIKVEGGRVREKPLDLALKPPSFGWSRVGPIFTQGALGRAGLGEKVFVQIPVKDTPEFRKGRRRDRRQRCFSGYDVNT